MRTVTVLLAIALAALLCVGRSKADTMHDADTNADGKLDVEELTELMDSLSIVPPDAPTNKSTCISPEDLLATFDSDKSSALEASETHAAYDHMISTVAGGACEPVEPPEKKQSHRAAIGGAMIAIAITSGIGAAAIIFYPLAQHKIVLSGLVALSMGTMIGDACLHIIPEAIVGEDEDADHSNKHIASVMIIIPISIVFFFVVEKIIHGLGGHQHHQHSSGAAHSHSHSSNETHTHRRHASGDKSLSDGDGYSNEDDDEEAAAGSSSLLPSLVDDSDDSGGSIQHEAAEKNELIYHTHFCYNVAPYGWMNIIGDGIHNFLDGVAIGVTFAASRSSGVATAIAVLLHEIPQEMGDYGVLFQAGFGFWGALFFNTLSACASFIGGLIGVFIATRFESTEPYLLAFTAGSFLYISLGDLLPQLVHSLSIRRAGIEFLCFAIGVIAMLLLKLYAE